MASLRCCTFNCRGWNTGYLTLKTLIDSLDLCFVQEHWLLNDHLYKIGEISSDFLSVSISGVDHDHFLVGRPYGGCSIIYRKSLVSFITPVDSCSDRFCAIKLCDSSGLSILIICVYMPGEHINQNPFDVYFSTLGELEGFIDSHKSDVCLVIGDFNVDFNCASCLKELILWPA